MGPYVATPIRRWACALLIGASLGGPVQAQAPAVAADPWRWDAGYKADLLHSAAPARTAWVGNLNLRLTADAGALLGWGGTTLHTEALLNHGSKPNKRIRSTQGISNLEVVESAARLYATWIEKDLGNGGGLLFGLYDLNSDFYSTEASGLLIHPSFGIGIDFSQSGRNGPSIFPNLGLALRGKMQFEGGGYAQLALIDGVPGDPEHPGRTVVRLRRDEGALLVGEVGWQERGPDGPKPGKWGIGAWSYTQRSDRLDGSGSARNCGVFVLAQALVREGERARTTGFVRAGVANRRLNAVDLAFDTGVMIERPFGGDGPGAVTAGLAFAQFGRAHTDARAAAGAAAARHETALELGARWQPWPALAVQPLLQRVWNTGGRPGEHATLLGVRLEWAMGSAAP